MPPLTVAGLGNPFRGDDGIGLALASWLADQNLSGVVAALWEDADALTLTHQLLSLEGPVMLVDSADMGLAPGQSRLFDRAGVRLHEPAGSTSTHGLGIATALGLAEALEFTQPVWFFGIQPASLQGAALSPGLRRSWPELTQALTCAIHDIHGTIPGNG
ncbi:MAG: hydrogenase maturation protease [Pseudomonadota bacterium]